MSDLRPRGVEIELGGQKYRLLLTLNAIDQIQERCNLPLYDAIKYAAQAADGKMDHDTIQNFRAIVTVLLNNEEDGDFTEKEVGKLLDLENFQNVAWHVLKAYGLSMPETDEDADDEDEDPNVETGQ